MKEITQIGSQVWSQVSGQVWRQVRYQAWGQVNAQVWVRVDERLGNQVYSPIAFQIKFIAKPITGTGTKSMDRPKSKLSISISQ